MFLSARRSLRGRSDAKKKEMHSRFSPSEELILLRDVAAAEAYIATYGNVSKKFEEAAEYANKIIYYRRNWQENAYKIGIKD